MHHILKSLTSISCLVTTLLCILISGTLAYGQTTSQSGSERLLDLMTGDWIMSGTIANQQVTHDVHAEWILQRRYLRIHEVSREKDSNGNHAYEAWVHIAWDEKMAEYVVMWLDSTGTTNFAADGVGHGKPQGDQIPFIWKFADGGGIRNTFTYDSETNTWSWAIDNVKGDDELSPFARVSLERVDGHAGSQGPNRE